KIYYSPYSDIITLVLFTILEMIQLKRIYQQPHHSDGYRILVDRLWPRGVSKENAKIDLWLKEIAPSHELRKWFNHDPQKWNEFRKKYETEIEANLDSLMQLKNILDEHKVVTLLFA